MSDRREFEFEIEAPPEAVWRALVDPAALLGWFASDARVTPEVGGEWYVAHGEYGESSTIEAFLPNERLATSHDGKATEFLLEGRAGTTVLRIVQSGFGERELASLERGWAKYMQTLRHYLTRHSAEPAEATYVYAAGTLSVEEARSALPATLPPGAEIIDETPRSLGALVPALGDGVYSASVEGTDGKVLVWVHLVAYGSGRRLLAEVTADVDRLLASHITDTSAPPLAV